MKTFTFPNMELDAGLVSKILSGEQPVYLYGTYGTGNQRTATICRLLQTDVRVLGIVSLNSGKWGKKLDNIEIVSPDELNDINIPVIVCAEGHYRDAFERLKCQGFRYIFPYYFYLSGQELTYEQFRPLVEPARREAIDKELSNTCDPFVLHSIDVMVTERCSLRCQACSNLMQYYTDPKHEEITKQLEALDHLMESIDAIHELRVLGGEPFVAPDLPRYIEHMKKYDNVGVIGIYTNGTIVPKGEVLECLKDPRVFVRISNYGAVSRNVDYIEKVLRENEIFFESFAYDRWLDCSGFWDRKRSEEELKMTFQVCCASYLYTLKGGKLYCCPFEANAAALKAIPADAVSGIDACAINGTELRNRVKTLVSSSYIKACKFCAGRPRTTEDIPAAVQTNKPIPYKRYDER